MEKEKYFIDLSKCSEEQQEHVFSLLPPTKTNSLEIFEESVYLHYIEYWGKWVVDDILSIKGKTELAYPEFIKLFEGGETIKSDNTQTLHSALKQIEKLEADKAELLSALEETNRRISIIKSEPDGIVRETMIDMLPIGIESLIQKHK